MKNIKATEVLRTEIPINLLHEEALESVKNYLEVASRSRRTESELPNALWSFLQHDVGFISEYTNVLTEALLALSKTEVAEPFRKEIGEHYFDQFAKVVERVIYMLDIIRESEAGKAEIISVGLVTNGSYGEDGIGNRIYLNDLIRTYNAMAKNTAEKQADWEAYDQLKK
jgi:hypothetical protein